MVDKSLQHPKQTFLAPSVKASIDLLLWSVLCSGIFNNFCHRTSKSQGWHTRDNFQLFSELLAHIGVCYQHGAESVSWSVWSCHAGVCFSTCRYLTWSRNARSPSVLQSEVPFVVPNMLFRLRYLVLFYFLFAVVYDLGTFVQFLTQL